MKFALIGLLLSSLYFMTGAGGDIVREFLKSSSKDVGVVLGETPESLNSLIEQPASMALNPISGNFFEAADKFISLTVETFQNISLKGSSGYIKEKVEMLTGNFGLKALTFLKAVAPAVKKKYPESIKELEAKSRNLSKRVKERKHGIVCTINGCEKFR